MIKAARLADKGHWPIAGGWLDQANVLVEAVNHVWLCEAPYKEE